MKYTKKLVLFLFVVELIVCISVFVFFLHAHKAVPIITFGPYDVKETEYKTENMKLKKGVYIVEVDYSSIGDAVLEVLPRDEALATYLKTDTTVLYNYETYTKYRFYLEKDLDVYISNHTEDGVLTVNSISVTYNRKLSGGYFSFKVLCLMVLIDFLLLLYYLKVNNKIKYEWMILTLIILVCCIPLTVPYVKRGHDVMFHLYRIAGLAESLRLGHIPARIQPNWFNGYGVALGVTYPDLLLYPQAILYSVGVPLYWVYKLFILEINVVTTLSAYFCYKKMCGDVNKALVTTWMYSLGMWRIIDVYTRQALGEYTAIVFLPFMMLGWYEIYYRKKYISYAFIFGITGVLLSHPLTFLMVVEFSILFMLVQWKLTLKRDVLICIFRNGAITVGLNMGVIVPIIDYYKNEGIGVAATNNNIQGHGMYLSQFFSMDYTPMSGSVLNSACQEMLLTPGIAIIFVVIVAVMMWCIGMIKTQRKLFLSLLVIDLIAIFMSTANFPYGWFMENVNPIYHIVAAIQFPWRYLTIVTALSTAILLLMLDQKDISIGKLKDIQMRICVVTLVLSLGNCLNYMSKELNECNIYLSYLSDGPMNSFGDASNFTLANINFEGMKEKKILVSNDLISYDVIKKEGTSYILDIMNGSMNMEYIELPVTAYRQYKCNEKIIKVLRGENMRLKLLIPSGYKGTVLVRYIEPITWRIAEIISVLTFIILIVGKRRHQVL